MELTFRWYGKDDPVTPEYIAQIPGVTGVMGMMNDFAAGEVWDKETFQKDVDAVQAVGLKYEVIESVNVHEDIKLGKPSRDELIENYKQSVRNVAACGVKVIVYNFMPVFDWLKTDLAKELPDGSNTLSYNQADLDGLTPQNLADRVLSGAGNLTLPGWEPERLSELTKTIEAYRSVDDEKLFENYVYFLKAITPTCEEVRVKMAVHPDDPAWPVFGIPRITHTQEQFDRLFEAVPSPANQLCLCTGSLGSDPGLDIPGMIRHFGSQNRIACAHVRNVKHTGERSFYESAHWSEAGDLDMYEVMKAFYEVGFRGYIRPDHGRMIWGEKGRAGYGLYDRALGATYLNGLWEALVKGDKTEGRTR